MDVKNKPRRKQEIWKLEEDKSHPISILTTYGTVALNKTASMIWRLLDGKHTIESIVTELLARFPSMNRAKIEKDVIRFIEDFANKDLIVLDWSPLG